MNETKGAEKVERSIDIKRPRVLVPKPVAVIVKITVIGRVIKPSHASLHCREARCHALQIGRAQPLRVVSRRGP